MGSGFKIGDGGGVNGDMKVNPEQRGTVHAVVRTESQHANIKGQGVNINTEFVAITADTVLLYIKNTRSTKELGEVQVFHITSLFVQYGNGSSPVFSGRGTFTVDFGGTGGTLIVADNDVAIKSNQNPGKVETFDDLIALVGASGETVTGVVKQGFFDIAGAVGARGGGAFDWPLPQGQAISVKVNPNLSSGSIDVYVNIAGYYAPEGI